MQSETARPDVPAAHAAGALLQAHWNDRDLLTIDAKRQGDFVSQADHQSEALLRDRLLGANPDDGWLGEETDARPGRRRWIVDPLDGTTNFLRGIAHWAVSIALEQDGQLVLGVVHDPLKAETFSAMVGSEPVEPLILGIREAEAGQIVASYPPAQAKAAPETAADSQPDAQEPLISEYLKLGLLAAALLMFVKENALATEIEHEIAAEALAEGQLLLTEFDTDDDLAPTVGSAGPRKASQVARIWA